MPAPAPIADGRFAWRGIDASGRARQGTLIAADAAAARAALKRQRITVLALTRTRDAPPPVMRRADVTQFTRQLAGLLDAGLPLAGALDVLAASDGRADVVRCVTAIARDLRRGAGFADALARHPRNFGVLYRQLIAVGEASGALAGVLARLATERERSAAQRAKLRGALAYPVGVLLLALAVAAGLLTWVVPTFAQIFDSFNAALPEPTRLVLALADAFGRFALPSLAAAGVAAAAGAAAWRRSAALRTKLDRLLLALPLTGALATQLCVARWTRALGTQLAAGVPLADAFGVMTQATGNRAFDAATPAVAERIRHGERLAEAMRATARFPAAVVQPIAVAEESGALDAMLADLATLYERQVDERIALLSSLAEPAIVALIGLLIGGLVIALYLPIIQLGNVV